jgi:hypothetical protein
MRIFTHQNFTSLALGAFLGLSAAAFAQGAAQPDSATKAPEHEPTAIQMEWNISQPSPAISALSEECERRFPGKVQTCDVIAHERKKEKSLLGASTLADVILGSDFGRRGKIVCKMGVAHAELGRPKSLPWLTVVQMQNLFESETLSTHPWNCAIQKCENGNCRKLGNRRLLSGDLSAFLAPPSPLDELYDLCLSREGAQAIKDCDSFLQASKKGKGLEISPEQLASAKSRRARLARANP